MKVIVRKAALRDLDDIQDWISKDSPSAAVKVLRRIRTRINRLAVPSLSHIGRPGLVDGTRELLEPPYLIIYKVDEVADTIVVLGVVHTARNRDPPA
jgi:addiction module RelE/StbE family toxin